MRLTLMTDYALRLLMHAWPSGQSAYARFRGGAGL